MTESEWQTCTDPKLMLEFLKGRVSDRKLRLFACACCRRIGRLLTDERSRKAIAIAEQYADGKVSEQEMDRAAAHAFAAVETANTSATRAAKWAVVHNPPSLCGILKTALVRNLRGYLLREPAILADVDQTAIIRDIFGNPFRPSSLLARFVLVWNDGTVVKLAQGIYDERAFARLPVVADALEEAGCHDPDILNHCRQSGEHVRGCWVVDLLLGKE